jgi:hypothetical protein
MKPYENVVTVLSMPIGYTDVITGFDASGTGFTPVSLAARRAAHGRGERGG